MFDNENERMRNKTCHIHTDIHNLPKNSRIQVISSGREGYVSTDGDDLYAVNFFKVMMMMLIV